jgi:hypothetical protein
MPDSSNAGNPEVSGPKGEDSRRARLARGLTRAAAAAEAAAVALTLDDPAAPVAIAARTGAGFLRLLAAGVSCRSRGR